MTCGRHAAASETFFFSSLLTNVQVQAAATVGLSAATQGLGWLQLQAERADNPFGSAEYSIRCLRLKQPG